MNWANGTCYEILQVQVAGGDRRRVGHGHLVEGPNRGKSQRGLGAGAEELKHGDSRSQLTARGPLHVDNGVGRLVDHHLRLQIKVLI